MRQRERPGEEPTADAQAKDDGAAAVVRMPLNVDLGEDVRQQIAELRGRVADDQLALQLVLKRKEDNPVAARADNTASPLHNPVRTDARAQPRASTRGSAVMPRPSTGSQSGDVEMSQAEPREPIVDLTSVYVDRSSEIDGVNDARVPSDTAAVAKRTSRTPGSL